MSWAVWIVRGIAAIAFGVLTLITPAASITALVFLFAVYAVVDGIIQFGLAFDGRPVRWPYLLRGLLGIAAGVIAFAEPGLTAISLYILIGAWAFADGIIELIAAFTLKRHLPHFRGSVLTGVLMAAFGVIMLALPAIGVAAVLGFIAAYAIMTGITSVGIGMHIHELVYPRHPHHPHAHAAA